MTFTEFCGMKSSILDAETGLPISHEEKYERAIAGLGGLDAVIPYIPFLLQEIVKALNSGDKHLNALPISRWDRASGFYCRGADVFATGGGLWPLLHKHGINAISNAEGVCLLKEAARKWAEREGVKC